ncbi:MAG TPA: adenylosuccinate lyase, partial [Steroidobacteraceae bacterium]|nr:adenylosuccinate lyase [Steroidobacteraceae bacterium]
TALSPVDGRYASRCTELRELFSESGLIRARVRVEVAWLLALAASPDIPEMHGLSQSDLEVATRLEAAFTEADAAAVKAIERETNHDVKAVEYFVKDRLREHAAWRPRLEFVHFACTSEDINNVAYALLCLQARDEILLPRLEALAETLRAMAHTHAHDAMMSRTHGQPATPTTLGKEVAVFVHRLRRACERLRAVPILGKMNGAVGNYNAHLAAYPDVDWPGTARRLVESLGLQWNPYTTQIDPHDWMAEYFDAVARANTVLIDLCRDFWGYISVGAFRQKVIAGEVGSSTMPHKVNPIDFENAEGNFGVANALLRFMADKLPVSRWQRDLTDSTVQRNIGVALAHSDVAIQSVSRGLARLEVDRTQLAAELDANWELLAEPIQTVMRRYALPGAYEQLKALTRGRRLDAAALADFIDGLPLPAEAKGRLRELTPASYLGLAARLARDV